MPAQRTVAVKVTLEAQSYFSALTQMEAKTRKTASSAEEAFARQRQHLDRLGQASLVASAGFTAAFVAMSKSAADFQAKLSQVAALGGEYEKNIGRLSKGAFTAGKAFGLSATQVADAQIELAKAGVSAADILGGALPGALALAAAGQIEVGKATSIASIAMTQFAKNGGDVPRIADLLAASADRSVGSVESVGDALNQSGLVAAQFGLSIEDTVGTLTSFSKAGLNGSDAGTSFKTMLLSLASPSTAAKKALDAYNISAYDSEGAFVGITSLAQQLQTGFEGVDQASRDAALSTIFGTDAVRAANVLFKEGAQVTMGFADAQTTAGAASLAAAKKLDNLNGDLQKLSATFQNDLIGAGTAGQDALRGLTQTANGLLTVFGLLPAPVQGTALGVTGVGAAVTAAGAAFLLLTPKIAAARAAMQDLNLTGRGLAKGFVKSAGIGLGIAAVTSGLAGLGSQGEITQQQLNVAAKSMDRDFSGLNRLFDNGGFANVFNGFGDARAAVGELTKPIGAGNMAKILDGMSFGITHFSDAYRSAEGQFQAFGEQFAALADTDYRAATDSFGQFADRLGGGTDAVKQALQVMPNYRDAIIGLLTASGQAASEQNILAAATGRGGVAGKVREAQAATDANTAALAAMSGSTVAARTDIAALADTIAGFGSGTLDARAAQRGFEQAVDDAAKAVADNGRTLDITTEAGRANQDALDGIAAAATTAAAAVLEQSGSEQQAAASIRAGRAAFIESARRMRVSAEKAHELADDLNLIPANVSTAVRIQGADAVEARIRTLAARVKGLDGATAAVFFRSEFARDANAAGRAPTAASRAAGGRIDGPGPKGRDSVLAYLAPGEHVLTADEVDRMGGHAAVYAFRKGIQGFAAGGAIGDSTAAAARYRREEQQLRQQLKTERANLRTQERQVTAAREQVDAATGQAAKKTANARLDRQEADVTAAEKRIAGIEKRLDTAKGNREAAEQDAVRLREGREDFVSQQRRGGTDPLGYIDQLRSMSRDDAYSGTRRKQFQDTANRFEQSLVDLAKQGEAAATELENVTAAADSMRSGISSAITGGYRLSDIQGVQQTGSAFVRDGISFQTTTTGVTADAIDAYTGQTAAGAEGFARDLEALARRGVDGRLLAEIAGQGVATGGPIAKALLTGTAAQIASINTGYGRIQTAAGTAAGTVTDLNFRGLIESAQANTDRIQGELKSQGDQLRRVIAGAFGLTGYAVGTMAATPGWHLVGERGPELLRFAGGEQVLNTAKTRAAIGAATTRTATRVEVSAPSHLTLVDVDGVLIGRVRVEARGIARQEIEADATLDGIHRVGGPA